MQQHRTQKPKPPSDRITRGVAANAEGRPAGQPPGNLSNVNHDMKSLASLVEAVQQLTEEVSKLKEAQTAPSVKDRDARHENWFGRILDGKPGSLLGFASNTITIWPVLCALAVVLLKSLPLPPQATSSLTLAHFLRPILPVVGTISGAALLMLASCRLKRKSLRLQVVMSIMFCYGAATVLYLVWQSLFFLHYNTLPSGVLLALTWVGIVSILRRAPAEVRKMQELVRDQLAEEKHLNAKSATDATDSHDKAMPA